MEGITIFFCPFKVAGTWKSRVQRELASLYFLKPSNHPTILPNFFQILVIHFSRSRSLLPLTNFPLPATAMNRRKSLWKYYRLSSFPTPFSPDHRVPFINFQFGKVLPARGIVRPTSPRNIVQPTKFVSIDFHCGEGHKKTDKTGRNFFLSRNYNFYLFVRFL